MNCQAKLISKLLRKGPRFESLEDTFNQVLALVLTNITVLEPTTHHRAHSPVPYTSRFGEYEVDAAVSRLVVTRQQPICQTIERYSVKMIELQRPGIRFHSGAPAQKVADSLN